MFSFYLLIITFKSFITLEKNLFINSPTYLAAYLNKTIFSSSFSIKLFINTNSKFDSFIFEDCFNANIYYFNKSYIFYLLFHLCGYNLFSLFRKLLKYQSNNDLLMKNLTPLDHFLYL